MWTRSTTRWLAYFLLVLDNSGYLGVQLGALGYIGVGGRSIREVCWFGQGAVDQAWLGHP